ncbi:hypothetical protein [Clostridium botulinum]|nr:hypothetical protein [Clostridium botulinum]MBY6864794.1 hypothetical protein [Clostridium botulinum]
MKNYIYDLNMNLVKQVKFYLKGTILAASNKDNTILDKLDETVVKMKGM